MIQQSRIEYINAFRSETLNNEREVWTYLPPGYDQEPEQSYPVLYVHDGQNIFANAYNGQSWSLHNVCDQLIATGSIEKLIIVAVANMGSERNSEYAHGGDFADKLDYPCRGEAYGHFLTEELKPFIDRTYRTKPESRNTGLMGSSRGGLVTYHIGFNRPDVFGKLAMLSPYFAQYDEAAMKHFPIIQQFDTKHPLQLWIDVGGMEGMTVQVQHVWSMVQQFVKLGYRSGKDLLFCIEPLAEHNEEAWRKRVHAPLISFFGNKGMPTAVEILGDDTAAVSGASSMVYPILTYPNNLNIVDLDASLSVSPHDAAHIAPGGLVKAFKAGTCQIGYTHSGQSAYKVLNIVSELEAYTVIDLEVAVPMQTPDEAKVYAAVELEKCAPGTYRRRFKLPRGTGFAFHITEHAGLQEADREGKALPKRRFIASKDLTLRYEVQQWKDVSSIY